MKLTEIIQITQLLPRSKRHLALLKKQLKTDGYQQLIQRPYTVDHNIDSLIVVVKSYFWACRLIKNCDCLPRSIALFQCLKSMDYEVEHKFGVNNQDKKLAAHAWVEYQGAPLNESEELYSRFTVLEKPIESLK